MSCFLVASLPSLGCVFGDLRWCWPVFCCMGLFYSGTCDWCCTLEFCLCLMYDINRVFECYVGKFVQKRSASMSKGGLPHECPSSVRMDGHDYFVISRDSVEAIEALMGN